MVGISPPGPLFSVATFLMYHRAVIRFSNSEGLGTTATTKISSLEINIFGLKNDSEKWPIIYFDIHRAHSEIPANLPCQFSLTGQIFLHWAAATLKGFAEFQNKKL